MARLALLGKGVREAEVGSHYEGVRPAVRPSVRPPVSGDRGTGGGARCEAPGPPSPALLGPVVPASAEDLAVLVQAPRDLHDARLAPALVLGTRQAGPGAVSQASGVADWLRRRRGAGLALASLRGTLTLSR